MCFYITYVLPFQTNIRLIGRLRMNPISRFLGSTEMGIALPRIYCSHLPAWKLPLLVWVGTACRVWSFYGVYSIPTPNAKDCSDDLEFPDRVHKHFHAGYMYFLISFIVIFIQRVHLLQSLTKCWVVVLSPRRERLTWIHLAVVFQTSLSFSCDESWGTSRRQTW